MIKSINEVVRSTFEGVKRICEIIKSKYESSKRKNNDSKRISWIIKQAIYYI